MSEPLAIFRPADYKHVEHNTLIMSDIPEMPAKIWGTIPQCDRGHYNREGNWYYWHFFQLYQCKNHPEQYYIRCSDFGDIGRANILQGTRLIRDAQEAIIFFNNYNETKDPDYIGPLED